jgi:hypothetical protein
MQSAEGDPQRFFEWVAICQWDPRARRLSPNTCRSREATSTLVPDANTVGADEVAIMAEVKTSAQQDPRTERPEVTEEGLGQSLAQPVSTSVPPPLAEAPRVDPSEVVPPP